MKVMVGGHLKSANMRVMVGGHLKPACPKVWTGGKLRGSCGGGNIAQQYVFGLLKKRYRRSTKSNYVNDVALSLKLGHEGVVDFNDVVGVAPNDFGHYIDNMTHLKLHTKYRVTVKLDAIARSFSGNYRRFMLTVGQQYRSNSVPLIIHSVSAKLDGKVIPNTKPANGFVNEFATIETKTFPTNRFYTFKVEYEIEFTIEGLASLASFKTVMHRGPRSSWIYLTLDNIKATYEEM